MNIAILFCQMQNIHIKVVSVLMACKHIHRRVRLVLRKRSAEGIPFHAVSCKPVKNQHFFIQFYHKTAVMYKNYTHSTFSE